MERKRNRFAPIPAWLEIGPAVTAALAELLFTLLVLAQSAGGTVFYRVTTKQTVDGVAHTYYHTESMQIGTTLLIGVSVLAGVTVLLAIASRIRELWIMRFLLPANLLLFCGIIAQAFLRPQGLAKHLLTILVGLFAGIIAVFLIHLPANDRYFRRVCWFLIALSVGSAIYGSFFTTNGSGAWLLGFQPGEFFKLAILILGIWGFESLRTDHLCLLLYILTGIFIVSNLLIVNDWGNGAIVCALMIVLLFALGHPWYAVLMTGSAIAGVLEGYALLTKFAPNLALTQKLTARFSQALFYPLTHWTESSSNQNIRQALLALVRGGLVGTGTASSDALYAANTYAAYTDFVFPCAISIFGIGFGVVVIIAIFVLVRNASPAPRETGTAHFRLYMGSILGSYFLIQGIVNVFGSLSLIPLTGVTLPFVSAGGSSMVVSFMALGCMVGLNLPREIRNRIQKVCRDMTKALSALIPSHGVRGRNTHTIHPRLEMRQKGGH